MKEDDLGILRFLNCAYIPCFTNTTIVISCYAQQTPKKNHYNKDPSPNLKLNNSNNSEDGTWCLIVVADIVDRLRAGALVLKNSGVRNQPQTPSPKPYTLDY